MSETKTDLQLLPKEMQNIIGSANKAFKSSKLKFQEEAGYAALILRQNPALMKCSPESIFQCLLQVATTGISLNPVLKQCYLIPRKGECCLDISARGLCNEIIASGAVKAISAYVIYENDEYDVELGEAQRVVHKPAFKNRGEPIAAYMRAMLPTGEIILEFMTFDEIEHVRNTFSKQPNSTAWTKTWGEKAKITVIKRGVKYLPQTNKAVQAAAAIMWDNEQNNNVLLPNGNRGSQQVSKKHFLIEEPEAPKEEITDASAEEVV